MRLQTTTNLGSGCVAMCYWVDERVKVERWEIGILCFDKDNGRGVVPREVDIEWQTVVEVREGNTVLCADRLANYDLVDVIKLVPILFPALNIFSTMLLNWGSQSYIWYT